ncbi:uncharacterized protein B0P05DRAFT_355982 [Gilbertella persicaria]|uniref:uncharacterized protein n=1 Tax=Gilbertella persicaria TaxID=101096 RepID=UPI00221EC6F8|nr:uncharacterized protein B0P05DRAFT_355982 [Gilbertella persicaria]KAI8088064.1 hypothetical protein B0P05DRAFT_355982 [Gilbertella persicaria]
MVSNESSRILPTTDHTQYQSIGPSEPEERKYFRYKLPMIGLAALISLVIGGVFTYGLVTKSQEPLYHNGTHAFAPTVIFISLDGVVNHDLDLHVTPVLDRLANEGIRAEYMTPSFPVNRKEYVT